MRWCVITCVLGCTTAAQPAPPEPTPTVVIATPVSPAPAGVRVTPKAAVSCGPDYLERDATSVSDLDHDGTLDRPSLVRTVDGIVVKLHELPSLREKGSWKLLPANGYLELATPRRRDSTLGDLWITVSSETAPSTWTTTLHHLEAGAFVPVTAGYTGLRIRVDVDGDGRVDPIGATIDPRRSKTRALVASGAWVDLPVVLPAHVHGPPTVNDQEEALDLDGSSRRVRS